MQTINLITLGGTKVVSFKIQMVLNNNDCIIGHGKLGLAQ